jgi:hypothetical protein
LETRSGDDSKKLQENMRRLKEIVLIMLAGTVKIFRSDRIRQNETMKAARASAKAL